MATARLTTSRNEPHEKNLWLREVKSLSREWFFEVVKVVLVVVVVVVVVGI